MRSPLRLQVPLQRMALAWADALTASIAGASAWLLANWLLGHPNPVFAIVSAIVCLSPGLPNHGRQAAGLMLGVIIGIAMGELALLVPDGTVDSRFLPLMRMTGAVFLSIMLAASCGLLAVAPIQAGVSAVLVLAMGPENAGWNRMQDVTVGVGVGLVFSQILLTPDPRRQIEASMHDLRVRLARGLVLVAEALRHGDPESTPPARAV